MVAELLHKLTDVGYTGQSPRAIDMYVGAQGTALLYTGRTFSFDPADIDFVTSQTGVKVLSYDNFAIHIQLTGVDFSKPNGSVDQSSLKPLQELALGLSQDALERLRRD